MSVYKRPGAQTYSYDFQFKGARFSGDTGQTSKREAERIETRHRDAARLDYISAKANASSGEMRFDQAVARFWEEIGQTHRNAETTLNSLRWLQTEIGAATLMSAITDDTVARLVSKRRSEKRRNAIDRATLSVGPATINRTVVQPLRHILRRASMIWKVKVGEVHWSEHLLREPKERVREASVAEEAAVRLQLRQGYDVMTAFAFRSGCRRMELLSLTWQRIDFDDARFVVVGKNSKSRTLPLTLDLRELLESCRGHHPQHVFTYVAARTDKRKGIERGKRYPITEAGIKTAFRRAVPKAGVSDFRFHDTRHTMATRTLRVSNIKAVQQMLGHEDLATTSKYAHVMLADLAAAMEAASPTKNPTIKTGGATKRLKKKVDFR